MAGLPPGYKLDPAPAQQDTSVAGLPAGYKVDAPASSIPKVSENVEPTAKYKALEPEFSAASKATGVPEAAIKGVNQIEDPAEDPNIISSAGAIGIMQTEPETFKEFSSPGDSITDPAKNILAGARYLKYLSVKYKGDYDKVFQAYNVGEGALDKGSTAGRMYAAQAEANMAYITKSVQPAPTKPTLSKGKAPYKPVDYGPPASLATRPGPAGRKPGQIIDPNDNSPDTADHQGDLFSALTGLDKIDAEAREIPDNITADVQKAPALAEAIQRITSFPLVQNGGQAAQFLGNVINLPLETINALMRDSAEENNDHIGDVAHNLLLALKDPKAASGFLESIAAKYGPNSANELSFWAKRPGFRDELANAHPEDPLGQVLQLAAGMHADAARQLITHTGLADILTFAEEWYNPGNKLLMAPKWIITHPWVKRGFSAASRTAPAKKMADIMGDVGDKVTDKYPKTVENAKAFSNWAQETWPIIGDRYKATLRRGGQVAADNHARLQGQIHRSSEYVRMIFGQEDKVGSTSVKQAQAIWREGDLFNNPYHTVAVPSATGIGDPEFDPFTQSTIGTKGGKYNGVDEFGMEDPQHDTNVYVSHTNPAVLRVGKSKNGQTELEQIFGSPQDVETVQKLLKKGNVEAALMVDPKFDPAEAKKFSDELKARVAKFGNTKEDQVLKKQFAKEMYLRRALAHYGKREGFPAIEWGDDRVLFTVPQKAIPRNMDMINGTTVHDHAMQVHTAINAMDEALKNIAPSMAAQMVEGYWPRSGAFSKEKSLTEKMELGHTAEFMNRSGTGGLDLNGTRSYKSIREAESAKPWGGEEKVAKDFDPRVPLVQNMVRSDRLRQYVKYLRGYAQPIDYQELIEEAENSGFISPIVGKSPGEEAGVEDEESGEMEDGTHAMSMGGPDGEKAFNKWIAKEADARLEEEMGTKWGLLDDAQRQDLIKKYRTDLFGGIEKYFNQKNGGEGKMTFRTADQTGVKDLGGYTVPGWAKDAAIDSHPAFDAGGSPNDRTLMGEDPPENAFYNAIESVSHVMRSLFLIDPTFHQRENLDYILFTLGKLNPIEIQQIMFAPHTIDPALMDEAERMQATSGSHSYGIAGTKLQIRNAFAGKNTPVDRNIWRGGAKAVNPLTLSQRFKRSLEVAKNTNEDKEGLGLIMHPLARAFYTYDKWNSDLTFRVWEDASAAVLYGKLRNEFKRAGMGHDAAQLRAARETRKHLSDGSNMTSIERKVGLNRFAWFYAWNKAQYRLWTRNLTNPRALAAHNAVQGTINTQNQETVPDAGKYDDKDDAVMWMGDKRIVFKATPGPWGKLQAVNALASTPFTELEGIKDFGGYVSYSIQNELIPQIKAMEAAAAWFQGTPGEKGDLTDTSMPATVQMGQLGKAVTNSVVPQQVRALTELGPGGQAVKALGVLGVPVSVYGDQPPRGEMIKAAILKKRELEQLYKAKTPEARMEIREQMGSRREELMNQLLQQSR